MPAEASNTRDSPPSDQKSASFQPATNYSSLKRPFHLVDLLPSRVPMGPRKKSKSKLNELDKQLSPAPTKTDETSVTQSQDAASSGGPDQPQAADSVSLPNPSLGEAKAGWYGSWKQKAKPVTEVARESIAANGSARSASAIAEPPSEQPNHPQIQTPSPKRYLSGTVKSAKGTPIAATTTNVSITTNRKLESSTPPQTAPKPDTQALPNETKPPDSSLNGEKPPSRPATPSGWFSGWWSRPDGYSESLKKQTSAVSGDALFDAAKAKSLPNLVPTAQASDQPSALSVPSNDAAPQNEAQKPATTSVPESKSWFWSWSKSQNSVPPDRPPSDGHAAEESIQIENRGSTSDQQSLAGDSKASVKESSRRNASGWAFWSTESKEGTDGKSETVHKQIGELAVANTPSQNNPEAAQYNEVGTLLNKDPAKSVSQKPNSSSTSTTNQPAKPIKITQPQNTAAAGNENIPKQGKSEKNLILPEFTRTYSIIQQPSIWQQLRQYFVGGEMQTPHLHISPSPPRIKKALAIGVHGFFPGPIFQRLLGAPTGTSIRFANNAATAIKAWAELQDLNCEIEKVALEGEGLITDRVDTLWKLLLNWIDHIRSADLILIACHSQGVPVSVLLVERLIKFKCIAPGTKIGICAMAGVNLGPFAEYKTQIFGRSALELFDFSNPKSKVSTLYMNALDEILKHGVKVVFAGSIDDQLVSLESSTFSNISHPGIYRAAFADGRLFGSDFITELVGFAFKLRNLGLSDHGLIRELSPALAGSLYTGEGHSRLYDCPQVYSLAVSHTLETTSADKVSLVRNYEGLTGSKETNPYFLPWAMRGILEEDKVRKELGDECHQLLGLFDEWKPTSKGLKDVKFRLEALRSKL